MKRDLKSNRSNDRRRWITIGAPIIVWLMCSAMTLTIGAAQDDANQDDATDVAREDLPLIEREPYDVIVFDSVNFNAELEVEPLDFPDRIVPTNRPGNERLQFRLIDEPTALYESPWRAIVEIRLYEQMVRDLANELTENGDVDSAYKHFEYLYTHHFGMPGLDSDYDQFLYTDALIQLNGENYEAALSVFEDLSERTPGYRPRGGGATVDERISEILDVIIGNKVIARDYPFARQLMARVADRHGDRQAEVITRWEDAIRQDADSHRLDALQHFENGEGRKAHESIRQMLNVLPDIEGGPELAVQIMQRFPLILVGTDQPARNVDPRSVHDWAARRVGRLCYRLLVEFEGQGQDGGQYRFPYGRIEYGEDGKSFVLQLTRFGPEPGLPPIDAYQISKKIIDLATEGTRDYSPAWRRLLESVEIESADRIKVRLTQSHVLPESVLQLPLGNSTDEQRFLYPNGYFAAKPSNDTGATFHFNPLYAELTQDEHPEIVELTFSRSEDAIGALRRGDIDVIDRVFPGDLRQLRSTHGVTVERYQLPTVHMLIPNKRSEHMKDRSFRLALLMGIDREGILFNSLLGGLPEPGFEVISGPFPIGYNDGDPINYGYNFRIDNFNYDHRLARTMVLLAEAALKAMLEELKMEMPPRPTLVLVHPSGDAPTIACREIARQWKMIGVECELRPLPVGQVMPEDEDWDLVYTQVSMREPLVDARVLLAEDAIVRSDNTSVDLALRQLDMANSWPFTRRRLNELHTFVKNEAVVIPLYQTVEFYAYRNSIRGVGRRLISLYDNVDQWRIATGQFDELDTASE